MAGKYWGIDRGKRKADVVYDTSTTSKKVEIYVEDGVRQDEAERAIEILKAAMKEKKVLPP